MKDPRPENITGEVRVTHRVNHEVNWSHLAIAVAVIYVAWKLYELLASSSSGAVEEGDDRGGATTIDVAGAGEVLSA